MKKIAICHYRVGGTDGVSLEIEKRKEILEKHGYIVKLIAGGRSNGADYTIKEMEWDNGVIPIIKENGFIHFGRNDLSAEELKRKMNKVSLLIEEKLEKIQEKEKFDLCLVHNIFSFGGHIAAAKAFSKWINRYRLPTLATHHDFFWERKEFEIPINEYLRGYLKKFMPPKSTYIKHVVINSLAQKELRRRNNIESSVMPDVFNFKQKPWVKDKFNSDFLKEFDIKPNDLIILQATRVIPRKGIELAFEYATALQKKIQSTVWIKKLSGKKIYNNKRLSNKPRITLILAGYAEDEKRDYLFKLKSKAFDSRLNVKFISGHVKSSRKFSHGVKTYALWDAYVYADIISFPSVWEGWGNQFIEAIFAKKPLVIHEYPVYAKDIKQEGYKIISLGNNSIKKDQDGLYTLPQENIDKAVKQTLEWLINSNLQAKLEKNFQIGKKYHDYEVLEKFLVDNIE